MHGRALTIGTQELRRQLASPLLWGLLAFTAFATLTINPAAMVPAGDAAVAGLRPFGNSRHALAQVFALSGLLFYAFLACMTAGLAILRDDEVRIGDLLHSTPLTPAEYVAGVFGGVVAALGGVILAHGVMAMAWYELGAIVGADTIRGPFHPWHYVETVLLFLAPGVLFCAGVAFAVGERTRSALPVYATATGIVLVTMGGLIPWPAQPGWIDTLFSVLDVWGARWLSRTVFDADRGVAFYNTSVLPIDLAFVLNRLFVLAVPIVAVLSAIRHCRRVVRGSPPAHGSWWRGSTSPLVPMAAEPEPAERVSRNAPLRDLQMTASPPTFRRGALETARIELQLLRGQPAAYLFTVFAILLVWEFAGSARGVFDAPVLLTPGGLAVGLVEVLTTLSCLVILFHTVESLDRRSRVRLHELLATSPVSAASTLVGVHLSTLVLVGTLFAGTLAACLGMLALQGPATTALWPFALVWGAMLAPTIFVWTAGVTALMAAVRRRYTVYVLAIGVLAGTVALALRGATTWVTNWPLWGSLRWSDMGTFELDSGPIVANRLLTMAAATILAMLAVRAYDRVERDAIGGRHAPARPKRGARPQGASAGMGLGASIQSLVVLLTAGVLLAGSAAWLVAGIEAGDQGQAARRRAREYWRRNVASWRDVPAPAVRHVEAAIRLDPSERRMRVTGAFTVANLTSAPLRRLAFTAGGAIGHIRWRLDDRAIDSEERSGLHVLTLVHPPGPGGLVKVGFAYEASVPRGFSRNGGGAAGFILPSGVFLSTLGHDFLPTPGFVEDIGLDGDARPEPRTFDEDFWRQALPPVSGATTAFTSHLEIDAPDWLTINAVGEKVGERRANGRTTVVWRSEVPVRFLTIVGGRWASASRAGTAIFHHPAHGTHVERMLATLVAAREHYSTWFGPYPWRTLTLNEYPDHVSRAQGFPTNIPFSEGMGFLTRADAGATPAAVIVTAHEAAHQWWGHLVTPGRGPGADVLIEGMAHYATLRLLEVLEGVPARIAFATTIEARYADERRVDAERPLTRSIDTGRPADATAIYNKGAWAFWMLEQHLGRARMDRGLGTFVAQVREQDRHPALPDLLASLRPLATDAPAFDRFVGQWFDDVVVPELQVRNATLARTGDTWTVTATAENVGSGEVVVDVSATGGAREARTAVTLAPRQPRTVSWTTPFRPDRLVVDPDARVLQLNRARAMVALPAAS